MSKYQKLIVRADLLLPNLPSPFVVMQRVLEANGLTASQINPQPFYTNRQVSLLFGEGSRTDAIWGTYWTMYRKLARGCSAHPLAAKFLASSSATTSIACYHPERAIQVALNERMWSIAGPAVTRYMTNLRDISPHDGKTLLLTTHAYDTERVADMENVSAKILADLIAAK